MKHSGQCEIIWDQDNPLWTKGSAAEPEEICVNCLERILDLQMKRLERISGMRVVRGGLR